MTMDDVPIVIKTATDSAQIERVCIFSLLLSNGETYHNSNPKIIKALADLQH